MSIKHIYGIRVIAGVSLLSALLMTFFSTFVFVTRVEDLTSKFPSSGVPSNISTSDAQRNADYENLIQKINDLWIKYRSVLVSSSMLATLAGLLQGIFSGLVLFSDLKSVRLYIKKWITVHFLLVFVLFIILLNTVVLTENNSDKHSWDELIMNFKAFLRKERPVKDFSNLYRFLSINQNYIYVCVSTNLVVILISMGTMMIIMRNLQDYEAYE